MSSYRADDEVVVLDFETTGMSADYDRIIEVGAAIVRGNAIVDVFSSLCNPGKFIPSFITGLTGITNEMVRDQPSPEQVMPLFHEFIGDRPVIAHNLSFDSRFLRAEMERAGRRVCNPSLCTVLLSRRLIRDAANYKLGTLKQYINFESEAGHKDHRALDDVKVTAKLWMHLRQLVEERVGHTMVRFSEMQELSRIAKHQVPLKLERLAGGSTA